MATNNYNLPEDVVNGVVSTLYTEAGTVDWVYLTDRDRTILYNKWVHAPEIGGRLQSFMPPEKVRVWLKDRPMKEYARAVYGVGEFASLVPNPGISLGELVHKALGKEWEADPETLEVKPLRVIAVKGDEQSRISWAPAKDFKHLVWAALQADAEGDAIPWTLCIVSSFEKPVPADKKRFQQRMANRCGLRIVYVVV